MSRVPATEDPDSRPTSRTSCPRWCVTQHGAQLGEEDWVHSSVPVQVAERLVARLCMSVDPDTGVEDGPYVLVGTTELTVEQARELGRSLLALATDATVQDVSVSR